MQNSKMNIAKLMILLEVNNILDEMKFSENDDVILSAEGNKIVIEVGTFEEDVDDEFTEIELEAPYDECATCDFDMMEDEDLCEDCPLKKLNKIWERV